MKKLAMIGLVFSIMVSGCLMKSRNSQTESELQTKVENLRNANIELRQEVSQIKANMDRVKIATENSLHTVILNKRNIGMIYRIITSTVEALVGDRNLEIDRLLSVHKVSLKLATHYAPELPTDTLITNPQEIKSSKDTSSKIDLETKVTTEEN